MFVLFNFVCIVDSSYCFCQKNKNSGQLKSTQVKALFDLSFQQKTFLFKVLQAKNQLISQFTIVNHVDIYG